MNVKKITQIVLGIAAIVLAYFLYESIMKPQRFEILRARKEAEVVNRLKDIRTAQLAYRNLHGRFCPTFDSLVIFLEEGRLPTIRSTGRDELHDSLMALSDVELLRRRLIRRDTVFSDAFSVLFPEQPDKAAHLAALRYVPFTNRTIEFTMETGFVERHNLQVPVIEVSAHMLDYLNEPEYKQLVVNAMKRATDMNRFPGRRFGSMFDPKTEGNWE
jgi:hypothetical protein